MKTCRVDVTYAQSRYDRFSRRGENNYICLERIVKYVDEIVVVVDSRTTDRTAEIVRNYGGKALIHEWKETARATGDKTCMANTIIYVLTNVKRESLSVIAKKFASLYDWSNVVKAEKEAYFKLIGHSENKNSVRGM